MSGHSKWSTIKRQKGAADKRRGQIFTKLANAVTVAVRQGGGIGDPEQNFKLRLTIEKARSINMSKEIIDRAIERGQGKGEKGELSEVVYEGFGPGAVAIIAEATTDNRLRTTPEVKNIFDKYGGTLGNPGAVSYQFSTKGLITVKKDGKTIDDIFLLAADAGADDVEEVGDEALIYTSQESLSSVKDSLQENAISIVSFELTRKPTLLISVEDRDAAQKILMLLTKLEEQDDVQGVYTNADISDEFVQE